MVKVAVITRTKNRSVFLRRAIASVSQQTYTDYQHLIINDGGDKSEIENILSSLPEYVGRKIKVYHRNTSSNAPDTIFNESIDRLDSEYFAIHDDDDTWHPDFLQLQVDHLDDNSHIGATVARADKVIETFAGHIIEEQKRLRYMPDLEAVSLYRQCIDNQLTPIATLYRRSAYEAVGKFDDSLPVVGDWEFGMRLLQKFEVDFVNPGYALACYHHRADKNKTNSFSNHNHRKYVTRVANDYLRQELSEGRLGVGYIMSDLKYRQDTRHSLVKKIIPKQLLGAVRKKIKNQ